MKNIALTIVLAFGSSAALVPTIAAASSTANASVTNIQQSDAELDSLLAPIALYPDTLLTHILIATTYPLDVIAADRWRQSNAHLSPEQVESVIAPIDWDPSVKALVPFTDILHTMAEDIEWMEQLGDSMLVDEARVLARVQDLRRHAMNAGNLTSNDYLDVEREKEIIYIAPRHRETVYVPYYDPRIVYGTWYHPITPRLWHHGIGFQHVGHFYWSPQVRISALFYFGGIHWHNRYVVTHRRPITTYYRGRAAKRVYSKGYQRWQHNVDHRRARYSPRVTHSTPKSFQHKRVVVAKPHKKTTSYVRGNSPKRAQLSAKKPQVREPSVKKYSRVEHALKSSPKTHERKSAPKVVAKKTVVKKDTRVSAHPVKPQTVRQGKTRAPQKRYTTGDNRPVKSHIKQQRTVSRSTPPPKRNTGGRQQPTRSKPAHPLSKQR